MGKGKPKPETAPAKVLFDWFSVEPGRRAKFKDQTGYSDGRITNWKTRGIPLAELGRVAAEIGLTYEDYLRSTGAPSKAGDRNLTSIDLTPEEVDLIERYRDSDPRWQLSLRLLSYVATEEQHEVAGDVNVILARAFGKSPREISYVSSRRVRAAYGKAPHVAAREKLEKERK